VQDRLARFCEHVNELFFFTNLAPVGFSTRQLHLGVSVYFFPFLLLISYLLVPLLLLLFYS
jgi:hypothetical protein